MPPQCGVADSTGSYHLDLAGPGARRCAGGSRSWSTILGLTTRKGAGFEGHACIERFLTVPVIHQGRVQAVVGVANKGADYDATDTLTLNLLMEAVWQAVEAMQSASALQRIEWLLDPQRPVGRTIEPQPYGYLAALNTHGLIRTAVGGAVLTDIVSDFLDLLETSASIYEKNGDYALHLVASGWCRLLNAASRRLCPDGDNRQALGCGRWLCHESCWTDTARRVIDSGHGLDRACAGGLRTCAVPVRAGGTVIGAMAFCYGDPPADPEQRRELAARFQVDEEELRLWAEAYETRPPFIIDLAKRRLEVSARLLGEMVERRQAEEALRERSCATGPCSKTAWTRSCSPCRTGACSPPTRRPAACSGAPRRNSRRPCPR